MHAITAPQAVQTRAPSGQQVGQMHCHDGTAPTQAAARDGVRLAPPAPANLRRPGVSPTGTRLQQPPPCGDHNIIGCNQCRAREAFSTDVGAAAQHAVVVSRNGPVVMMQIFVRTAAAGTLALAVSADDTGLSVKQRLEALLRTPASLQRLSYGGSHLRDADSLAARRVGPGSTLQQLLPLPGGAPVEVVLLDAAPGGVAGRVRVDMEADTPLLEVKRQLQLATGVPIAEQTLLLSSINQLVMGTKRGGLGYAHCGTASNLHFAVKAAAQSKKT